MSITKAIIPVAGLGTRFLPATKAQPKEMLPIVDKPVIQYIVEETTAAGISDIILITGANKRAIEDHFDRNNELETRLKEKDELELLAQVERISNMANFYYVRQRQQLGDGHAILSAKNLIRDEAVAVLFGDDLIDSKTPVIKQLSKIYEQYHAPVVAVMPVPTHELSMYGIVEGVEVAPGLWQIKKLLEKPKSTDTRSRLGIVGKYIITPQTIECLERSTPSHHSEWRLIDGLREQLNHGPVYAYAFEGTRYDCGNKLQFAKAMVAYALKHEEIGKEFRKFLKNLEY
ncbi:UTP--glucose-1-phosphate uridylyltransferase [Candidatus Uhrbacteria bacterium]|nr:UTP--glucose-1-phosphate uridylyltransferase [Candidatus Uhrbacteria bacterium]